MDKGKKVIRIERDPRRKSKDKDEGRKMVGERDKGSVRVLEK